MPGHRLVTYGAATLLSLIAGSSAAARQDGPPTFVLHDIGPGIWAALVVPNPPHYAFANSLVVDLGDGLLVVDTQQSPGAAEALIAELRGRGLPPVRWVVNTHWHGDHVLGNIAYRRAFPEVVFIGHVTLADDLATRTAAQIARDLEQLPRTIAEREKWLADDKGPDGSPLTADQRARVTRSLALQRGQREALQTIELVPPSLPVADTLSLVGSRRAVRVLALGPAHTRGDLVVWLPEERLLASGDLVEDAWPWVAEADIAGWLRALHRMAALDPVLLLPAHGALWRDPRPRLAAQAALFEAGVAASCGEGDAASAPPAALHQYRELLGFSTAGADDFWRALVQAAKDGSPCGLGGP